MRYVLLGIVCLALGLFTGLAAAPTPDPPSIDHLALPLLNTIGEVETLLNSCIESSESIITSCNGIERLLKGCEANLTLAKGVIDECLLAR
jgi:hypothetical protein